MKKMPADGLTLLELMVAISVSAILITLVLSSWNYINRHVLYQEHRGYLRNETARIADEIQLKLGRTSGVLGFTPNSVTLLEQDGGGVLEYAFDGKHLTKNGFPMHFGVHGGSITSFNLRNTSTIAGEYLLLEVTVSSQDKRDNRDTCRFTVNVRSRGGP
jgi:prepilin-type N-terminal cleavage/methylation domain-containing protein